MESQTTGEKLKLLRLKKKLDQPGLGTAVECSSAMICGIEKDKKTPSAKLAKRIATFFSNEITIIELLYSE